jgi:xanthine dehydrogenase accessory factor
MPDRLSDLRIVIRGAGEMATGTAWKLHRSHFLRILMTEIPSPLAVRRLVSFCEALHHGSWTVEGVTAVRIGSAEEAEDAWEKKLIPVLVDPLGNCRKFIKPDVVVDAILAKQNTGTCIDDAPLVLGMGPGFSAGKDVHYAIETDRGHNLGRLISRGETAPNTGVPGDIAGRTGERVLRAPVDGLFASPVSIGTMVREGEIVGSVDGHEIKSQIAGMLRGLIRPGTRVSAGLKVGDVDPRGKPEYCGTISEKARAIGGATLEAILMTFNTM